MKRIVTILLLTVCSISFVSAQTTVTLQPDAAAGKDALLHGLASEVNTNFGSHNEFLAVAWTFGGGVPGVLRSLVGFDLTSIPADAIITSAKLSLYARDDAAGFGQHSTLSGPNNCWLERITTNWDEASVTWSSQPSTITQNRVSLPASSTGTQNYTDIDVTALVQDMIANPSTSFGFMLKLADENYYRKLVFCSSDHANPALHPKIVVEYSIPDRVYEPDDLNISVYPNPASDFIKIRVNTGLIGSPYTISDLLGKNKLTGRLTLENSTITISSLSSGLYILKVGDKNQKAFRLMKR